MSVFAQEGPLNLMPTQDIPHHLHQAPWSPNCVKDSQRSIKRAVMVNKDVLIVRH